MPEELSQHKVTLARELLEDIELSRLLPEQLLLKATRLARLVQADEISAWLRFELRGYPGDDPIALKYMSLTKRYTDESKRIGYWIPLSEVAGSIAVNEAQMRQLQIPNVNLSLSSANPNEYVAGFGGMTVNNASASVSNVMLKLQQLATIVATLHGVRSRVLSVLHDFVSTTYYQVAFSERAESIFSQYKQTLDIALLGTAKDVIEKIPAIYDRLSSDDPEAVSQALTSCRRMIQSFADAYFPATESPRNIGGQEIQLGPNNYLNRISAYTDDHCQSESRRQRLRKGLREIHERVSAGVHDDVTKDEAKALFVQTYCVLGEIALLSGEVSSQINPTIEQSSPGEATGAAPPARGDGTGLRA